MLSRPASKPISVRSGAQTESPTSPFGNAKCEAACGSPVASRTSNGEKSTPIRSAYQIADVRMHASMA
jgi:hypothetical protein